MSNFLEKNEKNVVFYFRNQLHNDVLLSPSKHLLNESIRTGNDLVFFSMTSPPPSMLARISKSCLLWLFYLKALCAEEVNGLLQKKTLLNKMEDYQDYIAAFIDKILSTEGQCLLVHKKRVSTFCFLVFFLEKLSRFCRIYSLFAVCIASFFYSC